MAGLQQPPVSGVIYSQAGLPYYGMSQPQPGYMYPQKNPSYPSLGYNIGGQTPWQPQAQMPQPSFQQVSYPGFGQHDPQAFSYQNTPIWVTSNRFLMLVLRGMLPKKFHHTLAMLNLTSIDSFPLLQL